MKPKSNLIFFAATALICCAAAGALAQGAHHPFAVGANEGAVGAQSGFGAWLLARESSFYRLLTGAVRATQASPAAALSLAGLSFAYGVFHAAGPGHGKAVIASYMVSNEVALRRGLVIALLAALLQGTVAVAIAGIAALVFNATAARMTRAAEILELASYAGITVLGLSLVWRKGRALVASLRPGASFVLADRGALSLATGGSQAASRFSADDGSAAHVHGPDCGHFHMPDAASLSAAAFNWRAAAGTILTAGARPCSGAILVLVFSLAQGLFVAGVMATYAMSLGTAIMTGTIATMAVFSKGLALKVFGGSGRSALAGRLIELAAAACVLAFGLALLSAALAGVHRPG